jgi:hypothetical protein
MQVLTPEPMRGRVIGVITSATYAAGPLGLVLAGPAVDAIGLLATSVGLAAVVLGAAFLTLLPKTLHQLDDLREPVSVGGVHAAVPTPYPSHVPTPPHDTGNSGDTVDPGDGVGGVERG